jgi:chemotaxis protein MotB
LATAEAAQGELAEKLTAALAAQEAKTQNEAEAQEALAAALAARLAAEAEAAAQLTEAERQQALLATAQARLQEQEALASEAQKQQALLNQQLAALRTQLSSLQAIIDDFQERDAAAKVQLETLGSNLNAALARAASEERKRRQLEEAERQRLEAEKARLEAENLDLENYRSDFFGRLRELLGTQEGVRIVGDRFVFSSEVLFASGRADLSDEGTREIAKVAAILRSVIDDIPAEIDWIIRVDGHTDDQPLGAGAPFADNWELSQARALSVVRFMVERLGIPPTRVSANGFGEFQPVNPADTPIARAQNRRIELKLTER